MMASILLSSRAARDLMWGNGQDVTGCYDPTPDEIAIRRWQGPLRAAVTIVGLAMVLGGKKP